MSDTAEAEIRQNFHYFQSVVKSLMAKHAGQFALLKSRDVVGIYPRAVDAMSEGHNRFGDGIFSVQRVIDRPLDLGFMSYGSGERVTD